jgi:hypothetical protein
MQVVERRHSINLEAFFFGLSTLYRTDVALCFPMREPEIEGLAGG